MIGRANRPLTDQEGKEIFYLSLLFLFNCIIDKYQKSFEDDGN